MFPESLLADRTRLIELSGIRRVFELGKSLKDPVNLSIGQPHFEVPQPIREAAKAAIDGGQNGYTESERTYLVSTLNVGLLLVQLVDESISETRVDPE